MKVIQHKILFLCMFLFVGCAKTKTSLKKKTYGLRARDLYVSAKKLLKSSSYDEARKTFELVKTKFPYSRYATLSELGIADTYFEAEKYLQAIDRYKVFSKLHPSHPQYTFAMFQIAHGYYKLRPWNFFILPPRYQKDSSSTKQAIVALRRFLYLFGRHKLAKKATVMLKDCLSQMAKHEMHVGLYYQRKKKFRAVAWRMGYLLKNYSKLGLDAQARFLMGDAYIRLKEFKKAKIIFTQLLKKHAKSPYASKAKKKLQEISGKMLATTKKVKKATKK